MPSRDRSADRAIGVIAQHEIRAGPGTLAPPGKRAIAGPSAAPTTVSAIGRSVYVEALEMCGSRLSRSINSASVLPTWRCQRVAAHRLVCRQIVALGSRRRTARFTNRRRGRLRRIGLTG